MPRNSMIYVRYDFCILVALSLFVLPVSWVLGWAIAAGIHELFHIIAIRICRVKILSFGLVSSGAVIQTEAMPPLKEGLCALAGPVGGLISILFLRVMPQIAVCAVVQSVYNLIPVYPLDGGRAFRCLIALLAGEELTEKISKLTSITTIALIGVLSSGFAYRYQLGLMAVVFPVLPLVFVFSKNSLHYSRNNSTIIAHSFNSERTL